MALKQGIIADNPCDTAEDRKDIRLLADDKIPLFLSAIDRFPMRNIYAPWLVHWPVGGECLGLPWGQVGFEKGRITTKQLQKVRTEGNGGISE